MSVFELTLRSRILALDPSVFQLLPSNKNEWNDFFTLLGSVARTSEYGTDVQMFALKVFERASQSHNPPSEGLVRVIIESTDLDLLAQAMKILLHVNIFPEAKSFRRKLQETLFNSYLHCELAEMTLCLLAPMLRQELLHDCLSDQIPESLISALSQFLQAGDGMDSVSELAMQCLMMMLQFESAAVDIANQVLIALQCLLLDSFLSSDFESKNLMVRSGYLLAECLRHQTTAVIDASSVFACRFDDILKAIEATASYSAPRYIAPLLTASLLGIDVALEKSSNPIDIIDRVSHAISLGLNDSNEHWPVSSAKIVRPSIMRLAKSKAHTLTFDQRTVLNSVIRFIDETIESNQD